jgi:dihydrofolate reductase
MARRIIVQTEMSLDGIEDSPELWESLFDYHNDATDRYFRDQLFRSDALLMGRETYESWAEIWPTRAGSDDIADRMNSLPKYVASRTLASPLTWNAELLTSDVADQVAKIKQEAGNDLLQYGVGELTETMLEAGLVDELRFLVFPFVLGSGQRVYDRIGHRKLRFLGTKQFDTGVVAMHYEPLRS